MPLLPPGVLPTNLLKKEEKDPNLEKLFVNLEELKILDTFPLEDQEEEEGRMRSWRVGRMRKS